MFIFKGDFKSFFSVENFGFRKNVLQEIKVKTMKYLSLVHLIQSDWDPLRTPFV